MYRCMAAILACSGNMPFWSALLSEVLFFWEILDLSGGGCFGCRSQACYSHICFILRRLCSQGFSIELTAMKSKLILCLALVLSSGLVSCSTTTRHSVESQQWGSVTN